MFTYAYIHYMHVHIVKNEVTAPGDGALTLDTYMYIRAYIHAPIAKNGPERRGFGSNTYMYACIHTYIPTQSKTKLWLWGTGVRQ